MSVLPSPRLIHGFGRPPGVLDVFRPAVDHSGAEPARRLGR
ncbi:hypothetical protein ACWF94_11615 [Streptomyces sp. NPDC055078]